MTVELIAECSSNHGGDLELAKAFIWACAEAGADWVKFQSYQVATLRPGDPQREWLAHAELSDDAHFVLKAECERAKVKFLTTVFHASRVPFLASLGLEAIKVGSGEAREQMLTEAVEFHWRRIFVSCGLAAPQRTYYWALRGPSVAFLHVASRYPCPVGYAIVPYSGHVNFAVFNGWSDHAVGIEGCQLAILNGAHVIEKHVCLPEQKRPRKPWEATMSELRELRQFADDDPQKYVGRWQHPISSTR